MADFSQLSDEAGFVREANRLGIDLAKLGDTEVRVLYDTWRIGKVLDVSLENKPAVVRVTPVYRVSQVPDDPPEELDGATYPTIVQY